MGLGGLQVPEGERGGPELLTPRPAGLCCAGAGGRANVKGSWGHRGAVSLYTMLYPCPGNSPHSVQNPA